MWFLVGLLVGIIGASVAWFFIAKNNVKTELKAFAAVNNLPQEAKDLLKKLGINV